MKISEKDIGRRVVVNGECDDEMFNNELGKIVMIDKNEENAIAVEFDNSRPGRFHTCSEMAKEGHGFWVREDMITFTEEENKMDMDFQVGDEVETVKYLCKGVITEIRIVKCDYPILVKWENADKYNYDISGKALISDDCQSIYHIGSIKREGQKILIDPVTPEREKWVNIYCDYPRTWSSIEYKTEGSALSERGIHWIATIQLKRSK